MKAKLVKSSFKNSPNLSKGFEAGIILLLAILVLIGQSAFTTPSDLGKVIVSKAEKSSSNPFDSNSRAEELVSFDEEDSEDSHEEWSKLFSIGSLAVHPVISSEHYSLSSISRRFLLNRPAVSLFVLHHAWKSSIA